MHFRQIMVNYVVRQSKVPTIIGINNKTFAEYLILRIST